MRWQAIAVVALGLMARTAWATSCTGTYYAGLIGTMPAPLVLSLQLNSNSDRNMQLAQRFSEGLQKAGLAMNGAPTAQLTASTTTFDNSPYRSTAPSATGLSTKSDFGGLVLQAPDETPERFLHNAPPGPQSLYLRLDLRPAGVDSVVWTATVNCAVQTDDSDQLAYDLGALLGPLVGKSVGTRHF
jgi:hypothetical protein